MGAGRVALQALVVAFSFAVLSACAAAPVAPAASRSTPASSHTGAPRGPVLDGTVQTSEDVTLDTSFRAGVDTAVSGALLASPPASTCSAYAASPGGVFFPPEFDVVAADHSFYFSATAAAYAGPGEYRSAGNGSLTGTISLGVGVGGAQQTTYTIFRSAIGGSSSMTVRPDGSGTFMFTDWGSDEVRGNTGSAASISGTIAWTCGMSTR